MQAVGLKKAAFAAASALICLAVAPFAATQATMVDTAGVGGNAFDVACFGNPSYVWSMDPTVTRTGATYRLAVVLNVRQDTDEDCIGEASDGRLHLADVALELRTADGAVLGVDSGQTNAHGNVDLKFLAVPAGSYVLAATSVSHASVDWALFVDVANPTPVSVP